MAGRAKRRPKSEYQNGESADGESKKSRLKQSGQTSASPACEVPDEVKEEVERLYKLRMPDDFYHFWNFCKRLSPESPRDALVNTLGLQLVGPFDILSERHKASANPQPNYHLHYRHFYDPPELQTVLQGSAETKYHMGYFRDSPDALPVFIGENEARKGCAITQMGDNLFGAVLLFLVKKRKGRSGKKDTGALQCLEEDLRNAAVDLDLSVDQKTKAMKLRDKKVVTKAFHGAGIVVPVDKNDVGYRELPETDAALKRICKAIAEAQNDEERMKAFAPIQEMITFVQFANDECDYGMGYELGIDLFCYGSHYFYKVIRQLLPMAYNLLNRGLFGEILEAHLTNRSHDDLDQLLPS